MIKGIIFGAGGVLLDDVAFGQKRFLEIAGSLGLPTDPLVINQVKRYWGAPIGTLVKALWSNGGAKRDEFLQMWAQADKESPPPSSPEALGVLAGLGSGRSLVAFSNRPGENLVHCLQANGMVQYFDTMFGCDSGEYAKPDPRSLNPVLAYFSDYVRIKKDELLYIGDSASSDLPVANVRGVRFVAVTSGISSREEFLACGVAPNRIITGIGELPAFIES